MKHVLDFTYDLCKTVLALLSESKRIDRGRK
jgi:hypothetical protein